MAFTAKSLADGQVATTEGDLYAVPGATKAYIKSVHLLNTSATVQTLDLYIKRSCGTSRHLRRYVLDQYQSASFDFAGALSTGDAIRAVTTTTTVVDYVITGVEET